MTTATLDILATIDEPASSVLPHISDRLIQTPERYSTRLFFTNSGEPNTYNKTIKYMDIEDWQLAMFRESSGTPVPMGLPTQIDHQSIRHAL